MKILNAIKKFSSMIVAWVVHWVFTTILPLGFLTAALWWSHTSWLIYQTAEPGQVPVLDLLVLALSFLMMTRVVLDVHQMRTERKLKNGK